MALVTTNLHRRIGTIFPAAPQLPLVIWMILATIILGLAGGLSANELTDRFNLGWGSALGDFALILLPSFILAEALSQTIQTGMPESKVSGFSAVSSPFAAASMVCPDTAYAALSPAAGPRKLSVAFGSYAGFKLLYPAGPLIVATGLGIESNSSLMMLGLLLLIPVWVTGIWWVKIFTKNSGLCDNKAHTKEHQAENSGNMERSSINQIFAPFYALVLLLVLGSTFDFTDVPILDLLTQPKGALALAATWAVLSITPNKSKITDHSLRQECLNTAVQRTGSLLLVIGAASAFGAVLTTVVSVGDIVSKQEGGVGIISLFILTVLFKLAQGSSMATFAAVTPVTAPIVAASGLSPTIAVFTICLGSLVAILPNDSFYWLVRRDALDTLGQAKTVILLAGGSTLQALVGLSILVAFAGMAI